MMEFDRERAGPLPQRTNAQKHKNTNAQKHKNTETQKHKNTETQKHSIFGDPHIPRLLPLLLPTHERLGNM